MYGVIHSVANCSIDGVQDLLNDGTFAMQSSETLEERKLEYIKPAKSVEAQTPTSVRSIAHSVSCNLKIFQQLTRSIARFLAQSRHRNDASNREEFLLSIAEKRRRWNNDETPESTSAPGTDEQPPPPSCARADAKAQDRDVQMKYDIAKNEDGPLKRTMKVKTEEIGTSGSLNAKGKSREVPRGSEPDVTAERHPGLAGRLADVEAHLAVRYGEICVSPLCVWRRTNRYSQFLHLPNRSWTDYDSSKIISSSSNKTIRHGQRYTSTNLTEG